MSANRAYVSFWRSENGEKSENWKRLAPQPDGDGYLTVGLYRDGRCHRRKVHLLVLEIFVGPRPLGMQGCHNSGVLADCSAGNLRWDTPSGNHADKIRHGTSGRGASNGNAKLTEEGALEILAALNRGEFQKDIAKRLKVAPSTVSGIKSGDFGDG